MIFANYFTAYDTEYSEMSIMRNLVSDVQIRWSMKRPQA